MGKACALEGYAQVGAWRAQVRKRYTHRKAFVTLVFGDINLCCRLCLWNMHNCTEQSTHSMIVCVFVFVLVLNPNS